MRDAPGPTDHRDVLRCCHAIALIAAISAAIIVGFIVVRHRVEALARERLQDFQVSSMMLSTELAAQITRLQRIFSAQDSHTVDEPGAGTETTIQDRRAAVTLASMASTLEAIDLLQDQHGNERFTGTVRRARSQHARLLAALHEQPGHRLLTSLDALAVTVRQLHQLHTNALEDALSEMTTAAERRAWQSTSFVAAVLAITTAFILRLLFLIRARLHQHRETEEALLDRERQLLHAQKIQALGTLVGGVAHDFNNILTVILGHAHVLRRALDYGAPGAASASEIQKASERAASLTRQLLAFSRYELVERGLTDLNSTLRDLQPALRRLVREDISLHIDLGTGVGMARVDDSQLEQILLNLATNAADAMPAGGTLTIATSALELDPTAAELRGLAAGRYSRIRVEDTGCGMPVEVQSRVFEPFFTTKERGEGTGLGLSTIHGIVTRIGGHVLVDSKVGHGTRFDIVLPHEDSRDLDEGEDPEPMHVLAGSETVMLVEDDDQVRELVATGLREQGYRVLACSSGVEALRVCREHTDPIQVILTDVVLPEHRGPEVVERVREMRPDIAAVYMSGYTDEDVLAQVSESTDPLVPKPFKLQDLLRVVRQQADRHSDRQTIRP